MIQDNLILREVMRLIEDKNKDAMMEYLEELHPTDIAELLEILPEENRKYVFNSLAPKRRFR